MGKRKGSERNIGQAKTFLACPHCSGVTQQVRLRRKYGRVESGPDAGKRIWWLYCPDCGYRA